MPEPKFIEEYNNAWTAANPGNPHRPRIVEAETRGRYRFEGVANVFDREQILDLTKRLIGTAKHDAKVRSRIERMGEQVEISDAEQLKNHLATLAETELHHFSVGFAKACANGEAQSYLDDNLPRAHRP